MGNFGIEALAAIKVFEYFADSNFAGKVVIFVLVMLNCTAIALMWTKFQEIKRALRNNARDEKRINNLTSIFDYDDALFAGEGVALTFGYVPVQWMLPIEVKKRAR